MMIAAFTFPNFDPVAFKLIWFPVRWYALAYVAGLLFALWYIKKLVSLPKLWGALRPTLTLQQADDIFLWFLIGVIVGGRLGYVLLYKPMFYLTHPFDILRTMDGGMSFHGGFLGVVIICMIYGWRNGIGLDRLLDLGAAATPVGLGLGRFANFINAELWGRVTDVPWGVVFPGQVMARHPSQLYEAALEGIVLFFLMRIATHRFGVLQHAGRASGIYALFYGCVRIFVEFFREPDSFIGYYGGFMTWGMVLSLPMVLVGIWLLWRSRAI
jgi:phosphatidylglycerol---prolipoprotein diacylglyceryl transferase